MPIFMYAALSRTRFAGGGHRRSALRLARMRGMLYGMIAGLLMDISAGTLGMKPFPFIIIGFLIGFLLDQQPEIVPHAC